MDADRHDESSTRSPSGLEQTLEENDPEFIAACLAVTKGPAVPGLDDAKVGPEDARGVASPRVTASGSEHDQSSAARANPAEMADSQRLIRRLEAHIDELREALTESQAQIKESSESLRENEVLRQSLARAREQHSADVKTLEDLTRHESDARSEVETLHQVLSAMKAVRGADNSDLTEARRREAQVRTELQTLREELNNVEVRHDDTTRALEAAIQRDSLARAELATATTVISDRDSTVEQLRHIINERDREIEELRQHLLEAEEARGADAAAILDSLKHRT